MIGGSSTFAGFLRTWNGIIDELQAYNRSLSLAEIQSIYTAASSGVCKASNMTLSTEGPLVGVARSISGTVSLSTPAASGGVTVNLSSSDTSLVTVSPTSVTIPQGGSTATFAINGIAAGGPVTLTATATNYNTATASVTVTSSLISLATGLVVAPSQTSSLAFSLSTPAPTGGVVVSFTSDNPSIATVTSSVTVPAGSTVASANPQVTGVSIGTAHITASATGFAPDTQPVQVTVTASLATTTVTLPATRTFSDQLTISAAAPPPNGITFNLSVDNTSVATVPATITIPAGQLSANIVITGVASGTANLTVSSPGINSLAATISVSSAPAITVNSLTVGNNLIEQGGISLGAPPQANETMTLSTNDPTHFLLTADPTKVGTASITLPLTANSFAVPAFYIEGQNFSGNVAITATLTATASGLSDGTATLTLYPTGISFLSTSTLSTTTSSPPSNLTAYVIVLTPGSLNFYTYGYNVGPQASAIPVTVSSSDTTVGTVGYASGSSTSIPVGSYLTPGGGVTFKPLAAGASNLTLATPAGYSTPANESVQIAATVSAPALSTSTQIIGNNLIVQDSLTLGAAPPTNETLTLTSSDPTHFLLTADPTKVGTASITMPLTANSFAVPAFYIEGQNYTGTTAITATLTASAPGYANGTATLNLYPTGLSFLSTSTLNTTTFSPASNVTAYLVVLSPGALNYYTYGYPLGPQASAIPVTVSSSNTNVGTISYASGTSTSIAVGFYATPNLGVVFNPVTAGTTNLNLTIPAGYSAPTNQPTQIVATVSAPSITVGAPIVGNNLIVQGALTLAAAPPTNETLTLTSSDPTHFLLTSDATKVGSASITLPLTANSTNVPPFYIEGQNYAGTAAITATVTASASGYSDGNVTVTLYPTGLTFFGSGTLSTTTTSGASNVSVFAIVLSPGTLTYYTYGYNVGPQAGPGGIPVTVSSSAPAVGRSEEHTSE